MSLQKPTSPAWTASTVSPNGRTCRSREARRTSQSATSPMRGAGHETAPRIDRQAANGPGGWTVPGAVDPRQDVRDLRPAGWRRGLVDRHDVADPGDPDRARRDLAAHAWPILPHRPETRFSTRNAITSSRETGRGGRVAPSHGIGGVRNCSGATSVVPGSCPSWRALRAGDDPGGDQPQLRPPPPLLTGAVPPPRTLVLIFIFGLLSIVMAVANRLHTSRAAGVQPHK